MHVQVNGEIRELPDNPSLLELVENLGLTPERVAVELNRNVIRRIDWSQTLLKDNDRVEIVHFVGGG